MPQIWRHVKQDTLKASPMVTDNPSAVNRLSFDQTPYVHFYNTPRQHNLLLCIAKNYLVHIQVLEEL